MASPNNRRGASNRRSGLTRLQTEESQNNRFSWTMTPAQTDAPTFDGPEHMIPRPETIFDDSPTTLAAHGFSAASPEPQQPLPAIPIQAQASVRTDRMGPTHAAYRSTTPAPAYFEGPNIAEVQIGLQSSELPPSHQSHPALQAPYAEPQAHYASFQQPVPVTPVSARSPSSYIQSQPYTLPSPSQYTVASASTFTATPHYHCASPSTTTTTKAEPYGHPSLPKQPVPVPLDFTNPYHHSSIPRSSTIPAYTPGSPLGPNSSASVAPPPNSRLPRQISHSYLSNDPSTTATKLPAVSSPDWRGSTLTPSTTCLSSLVCPCIVYGRVQYRLSQRSRKAEPTDLNGYSACNGDCGIMALACGLQGLLATIQRKRVRSAYGIEGGIGGDCLRGCCCCCCVLAANEREVIGREEERRRLGVGGGTAGGYVRMGTLSYAPPPR